MAWLGGAWLGVADMTRRGVAGQGEAWHGMAGRGGARHGRQGAAWQENLYKEHKRWFTNGITVHGLRVTRR
jgi:hypothetical protein